MLPGRAPGAPRPQGEQRPGRPRPPHGAVRQGYGSILERHGRTLDEFGAGVHFAHIAEFQVIQNGLILAIARQQRALRDLEERGASGPARGGRQRLTTPYGSGFAPRTEAAIGYDVNERLGRRTFDEHDLAASTEDDAGPDLAHLDGTAP